ncbi:MAP kinase-activated protein kinase 5-like [Acanthaster planci]|uniref:MAP kinase-activated protein kinase 5-like n=1 Tax=Acanthaster planci TaxID=133434 RepID=A0A8B7Y152_ACAPL|nr:MAP kinase-activated protein kinase 5-like [Acanthaster planci]
MEARDTSLNEVANALIKFKTSSIVDDYTINWKQKLGTGVNGPVWPCKKNGTNERYALKVLADKPSSRTEITLHSHCSGHQAIVTLYDVYANEVQFPGEAHPRARLLMVMELMDGGELFDRISQQKGFTEAQAVRYAKQIASSIQRCHSLNIAHRDLKPENLLLKDNSENSPVKLSDFGFAKVDDGTLATPHFTPYYVAPQVLEAQRRQRREEKGIIPTSPGPYTYDKSCDIWSVGVIIYIMLCGYPPFYPETPSRKISREMCHRILAGQYDFPSEEWAHISDEAKDVVNKLLRVDPMERLTVHGLMEHPWMQENRASNRALNSPAIMLDKNLMEEAMRVHSEQLTSMRLPQKRVVLKPVAKADNPIIRKRARSCCQSVDNRVVEGQPEAKLRKESDAVTKLRDVIAYCILPPQGGCNNDYLCQLVQIAQEHNDECNTLRAELELLHWNGKAFTMPVDSSRLALALSKVVKEKNSPNATQ